MPKEMYRWTDDQNLPPASTCSFKSHIRGLALFALGFALARSVSCLFPCSFCCGWCVVLPRFLFALRSAVFCGCGCGWWSFCAVACVFAPVVLAPVMLCSSFSVLWTRKENGSAGSGGARGVALCSIVCCVMPVRYFSHFSRCSFAVVAFSMPRVAL